MIPAVFGIFAIIGAFIGLVAFASKASFKLAKQRAADLEAFAAPFGMRMVDRFADNATQWNMNRFPINFNARDTYPAIDILRIPNCRIYNVLEGLDDQGRTMRTFDASYTVSTGKSSTTYYYSFATVDTGQFLPELAIRNETLWDKIKAAFGNADIEVGNESFDKLFRINCSDEAFARSLIMSEMQDRLQAARGFSTFITKGQVVVMKFNYATPQEFSHMLDHAAFVANRATRPEPMSQVRYALEHATPPPIDHIETQIDELS